MRMKGLKESKNIWGVDGVKWGGMCGFFKLTVLTVDILFHCIMKASGACFFYLFYVLFSIKCKIKLGLPLVHLVNCVLQKCIFPEILQLAIVKPLHKNWDKIAI